MAITTTELLDRPRSTSAAGPATAYVVMLGILVVAAIVSVLIGSRLISPTAVLEAGPDRTVIEVRAVRTALGILVGVALGLAGAGRSAPSAAARGTSSSRSRPSSSSGRCWPWR